MFKIDELLESDLPSALRLSTEAGWNQTRADWQRLLSLWPGMGLAGRLNDEVIATATLAVYGNLAWVGMVLVDQRFRGRGYGKAILDAVIELGRKHGATTFGLDATPLGRPIYLKCGFRDVITVHRWVRQRPDHSAPANGAVREMRGQDWSGILQLDREAAGVDRASLLRHIIAEPGVKAWVNADAVAVRAYALARPGRSAWCVGPVVGADERVVAKLLDGITFELDAADVQSILLDVPKGCLQAWLEGRGFAVSRQLVRMATDHGGKNALLSPLTVAIAALELG